MSFKIISKKLLKTTLFLNLYQTNYINNRKKLDNWIWVGRPNKRKAVIIACLVDDKLVVTEEYRIPINGYELGLPAGLIDNNETPEDAVIREMKEETGLDVTDILEISPPVNSSSGITDESVYIAYVKATGEPNTGNLGDSEDIRTYLMDKEEVKYALDVKGKDYTIGKTAYSVMRTFVKYGGI
jgi:ADP-ribose pyrophosphatase